MSDTTQTPQATPQATPTQSTPTNAILERLRKDRTTSSFVPEIERVAKLPIVPELTPEQLEIFNKNHVKAPAYDAGFRYFDVQAKAVLSYDLFSGLFCFIGCGFGKTAITLLIAYRAFRRGIKKILLLVPADVYLQLVKTDIPKEKARTPLDGLPFIRLGKAGAEEREIAADSNKFGCYIMPYSMLSVKNSERIIQMIAPQLIIADEAHNLKNKNAARTKRLMRYIEANAPQFVALSGSMTTKGVKDYHHLIRAALGKNCPLPMTWEEAQSWGMVIDATSEPDDAQMRELNPLMKWAHEHFPDKNLPIDFTGYRKAYEARLTSAPGVISSGDRAVPTSLIIRNTPIKTYKLEGGVEVINEPGGDRLMELIYKVDKDHESPNGDEIEDARQKFKYLRELSAGFYYELKWPTPEYVHEHRTLLLTQQLGAAAAAKYTMQHAKESLAQAQAHHKTNQWYLSMLRAFLTEQGRPGLDTPSLVALSMYHHGAKYVPNDLYMEWLKVKAIEDDPHRKLGPSYDPNTDKGGFQLVERLRKGIPVCAYKVNYAVEWALTALKDKPGVVKKNKEGKEYVDEEMRGGIIWVYHNYMGKWVYNAICQALTALGVPTNRHREFVLHCPRGEEADGALRKLENGNKILVTSMAHRTGKNLQHMQKQLFVQFPREAEACEQALARIHRTGQLADEIHADTCNTLLFDYKLFSACLNDALYTHQTTASRQRVVYARHIPRPKIFPPEVLREQGLEPMDIGEAGRKALLEMGEGSD